MLKYNLIGWAAVAVLLLILAHLFSYLQGRAKKLRAKQRAKLYWNQWP